MCDLGRLLLYGAADEIVEGFGDLLVGDCEILGRAKRRYLIEGR